MAHSPSQVVLVEDDPAALKALERVIRAAGFDPVCYTSAEGFLASPPVRLPLCLVLDIMLGGMSGIDLQRRLRAMGSSLPVIVLTAVDADDVRDEAYQLGCTAFLPKDADAAVLLGVIRTLECSTRPGLNSA
jgi:FixJ family two-component response regulator